MSRFYFVILCFFSTMINGQTKRGLVIGIGEQKDKHWTKINGDNDVQYVKAMLETAGYKDIYTLVNKQATKAAIVRNFKKLASNCEAGDVIYIHFSGHGQQVTDVNGDEGDNDKWDEAWIPYDAYLTYGKNDKGEKHLIDDEVNVLLTTIKNKIGDNGKMLVVVDACHSGESTFGYTNNYQKQTVAEEPTRGVHSKFIIPDGCVKKVDKTREEWLTLSACKDYQLNQEMRNPKAGKLTYALYTLSKKGAVTIDAIQLFMERNRGRYAQTPMQTGETSKYKISDFLR